MSELLHTTAPYALLHLMFTAVFLVDLVNMEIKYTKRQGVRKICCRVGVCVCV